MSPGNVAENPSSNPESQLDDRMDDFDPLAEDISGQILSRGAIKEMPLPAGWLRGERKEREEERMYSYEMFHPQASKDVHFWYYFRGYPMTEPGSAAFTQTLQGSPHELSPAEVDAVREIMRDKGDSELFDIDSVRTERIGGKTVLVVEGVYPDSLENAYSLYVDAEGTGRIIQELHLHAPQAAYPDHVGQVKEAVSSIVWT